ncbi:hypothetical protein NHQ30_003555 [Ciborinia camelliae]|nr:hypothetical protein NHQ30_003555 [Ciborinia camelliae]
MKPKITDCTPTLTAQGVIMKYVSAIIAKETGSEILNKPTLEEIQTAKKVDDWYEGVRKEISKANEFMKVIIRDDILQKKSSKELLNLAVEHSQQTVENYLRKNNPFELSDEVISSFRYRADPLAFQDAKKFFCRFIRILGVPLEEF